MKRPPLVGTDRVPTSGVEQPNDSQRSMTAQVRGSLHLGGVIEHLFECRRGEFNPKYMPSVDGRLKVA